MSPIKLRSVGIVCAANILSCLVPLALQANGGGYSKGLASTGAFKPFGIEQVEMVSERLEIDLHIEYAEVRIEYVLHNPGPKVAAEAGFPSSVERKRWMMGLPETSVKDELHKLEDLELTVDGQPVSLKVAPDDLDLKKPGSRFYQAESPSMTIKAWHVFQLDFAKGQTRRVTVMYRHPYADEVTYVTRDFKSSGPTMAYIFSSAAAWQGPISQGTVIVRALSVNPEEVQFSHPKRFKREGSMWTWLFTDFEPTLDDDMVISVRPAKSIPEAVIHDLNNGEVDTDRISYVNWHAKGNDEGTWEVHRSDFVATASSALLSEGSQNYDAEMIADHNRMTAWVEGGPGDGIGESITLTLPKAAMVRKVGIVNGFARSEDLYMANGRVAKLDVSVNGGKPSRIEIPDELLSSEYFYFDLPGSKSDLVKSVTLTIAGVYKGTKFQDTCISDVVLVQPLSKKPKLHPVR